MKCNNCGHANRRGVKFCEECGELLKAKVNLTCPSCGHKNRVGVKFCEECGANLGVPTAPEPAPAPAVSKPPKKTVHRLTDEESAPPAVQQTVPPVIVEVRQEKKRRLNPLWLLLLLLLLLTCCCGLLLTEQVEVPDFAAPYVEPYIEPYLEDMRESYKRIIDDFIPDGGGQPKDEGMDCDEFAEKVDKSNSLDKAKTECVVGKTCTVTFDDMTDLKLEDYGDIEILYQFPNSPLMKATCKGAPKDMRCQYPYDFEFPSVVYYISLDECEKIRLGSHKLGSECGDLRHKVKDLSPLIGKYYRREGDWGWYLPDLSDLGLDDVGDLKIIYKDNFGTQKEATCEGSLARPRCYPFPEEVDCAWIRIGECDALYSGDEKECGEPQAQSFTLTSPSSDCCKIVDVKKVRMEITNKFILKFDVECDGPWPASGGDCIPGKTYIGADQDIFWADVDCCPDSSADDLLHCESGHVDQKVSWTKVELSYGECDWKSPKFFTPAYQQDQRFPDSDSDSDCPSGESMCAGSCCSIGYCCTCDGSLGCWSNCSDTGCY